MQTIPGARPTVGTKLRSGFARNLSPTASACPPAAQMQLQRGRVSFSEWLASGSPTGRPVLDLQAYTHGLAFAFQAHLDFNSNPSLVA
jgi:hypothetical protein